MKAELLIALDAVSSGHLHDMSKLKNAPGALAWKVAFLYQDRQQPLVLPFYNEKQIRRIAGSPTGSVLQLQVQLMAQRGEQDLLTYAAGLEKMALDTKGRGESEVEKSSVALNQILFGPPGTGKTYSTINHALAILDPELVAECPVDDPTSRTRLKKRFDELVNEERVRFATFHQSFSYEDFVEGLRADSDGESGALEYRVEAGIFKQLCDDARTRSTHVESGVRPNPRIWKISINGTGQSPTKTHCMQNGEARVGWGKTGDLGQSSDRNAYYEALGSGDKGTLSYFAEEMAIGDVVVCIQSADLIGAVGVITGDYFYQPTTPAGVIADYQHVRPVRWLYRDVDLSILPINDGRQFTLKTVYALNRFSWADLLTYLEQHNAKPVEQIVVPPQQRKPFVLIIDEINRGNVSRIFGELITLIEPSKREGADEALTVKLPYSKKPFSVPDNVYLLGTMNTADRSLAGLDIALRRRFSFVEMPPRPDLLDGLLIDQVISVGELLRVMNQRIEVLLGREHCLGHAYFMPLKEAPTREKLAMVFRNQILPLLQEYFFEDWQRIQWVLNDHRKSDSDRFVDKQSKDLQGLFGTAVELGLNTECWAINDEAFERIEAYLGVIDAQMKSSIAGVKHEATYNDYRLCELASGSIDVWVQGVRQTVRKPHLRELAATLGVSIHGSTGNDLNTQSLGKRLITELMAKPA